MITMTIIITVAYLIAGLVALGFIVAPRRVSLRPARWCMVVAFALHTAFFLYEAVWYRYIPVKNLSQSLFFFLWVTVLVAIFIDRAYRLPSLIAYLMPLMMLFAVPAMVLVGRGGTVSDEMNHVWLAAHIVPAFLGYGLFTVGFIASVMYLLQEHRLKTKKTWALVERFPSQEVLETVARKSITLGLPVFSLGLIFGVIWARQAGHLLSAPWYEDPKIIAGILTWVVYVVIVHIRLTKAWHGRKVAYLTIWGFAFIMFTFVGTFFLGAQHAYKPIEMPSKADNVR